MEPSPTTLIIAGTLAVISIWFVLAMIFILPIDAQTGFQFHKKVRQGKSVIIDFAFWPITCLILIIKYQIKQKKERRRGDMG